VSGLRGGDPEVSIVVVPHDDDDAVARSVRAASSQSLRAVEVLVSDPPAGLEQARGAYTLFVDAGDELDRHACRALLAAAEELTVDVVAGRWLRRESPGRAPVEPDVAAMYHRTRRHDSLAAEPGLLRDASFGNKLFARSFLGRVASDVRGGRTFEQLRLVTEALVLADGIAVIPQQVCVRAGWPTGSVADLLAVQRDIDRFMRAHAAPSLQLHQHVKFLEFDLPVAIRLLAEQSDETAEPLFDPLRDYLDSITADAYQQLEPMIRIAAFLVRHGDLSGIRTVVDYLAHDRKVTTRLVQREGRVYWLDRYLDTPEGRRALDVTTIGFQELQLAQLHLDSRIDELAMHRDRALVRGHTINQLGRLAPGAPVTLALSVAPAGTNRHTTMPLSLVEHTAERLTWQGNLDLSSAVRPTWRGFRSWSVRLVLTAGGERTLAPLSVFDDPELADRRLMSRLRWYPLGNVLRTELTARGNLALRLSPEGFVAMTVERLCRLVLSARLARAAHDTILSVRRGVRRVVHGAETKSRIYRDLLVRLPVNKSGVVFENHMGQSFSDNPRYVFEELYRRNAGFDIVWSFAGDPPELPPGVRTVRRNSWRYFLALARARYWVDNQGLPPAVTKPSRTIYLQTWHGSALKRMGEDTPGFRSQPEERQQRHRDMVARWSYFLARTEHDVRTLVPALRVRGEVLRYGYPRNDPLSQLQSWDERAAVRAELGLPADAVLVLYAPTFRETYSKGRQDFVLQVDLDHVLEKLPGHLLLVRTHYLQRLRLPAAAHAVARDVSHYPDITPLMVAADILVTDYSSVMFDFANTGRPMVFFAYDYDDYVHSERGVYFELADKAPGPLVHSGDELVQALASVDSWRAEYADRYQRFIEEFGEYDTGNAARQVVDHVFFGTRRG
jgi:CDP-glycerol glycerophosphotransferase